MDGGGADRLSSLPEDLKNHIFSLVETIDVVKMSLVSKQWRYFWRSIPYLSFKRSRPAEPLGRKDPKFVDFVDHVIMSRNHSIDIRRCSIGFLSMRTPVRFWRWMDVITGKSLQQLDLDIFLVEYEHDYIRGIDGLVCYKYLDDFLDSFEDKYEENDLSQSILDCESLVSLSLDIFCRIKQFHVFPDFRRLKSLALHNFEFHDPGLLQNLISSCPVLENCTISWRKIADSDAIEINTSSLKKLSLGKDTAGGCENYMLKVVCPNLQYLALDNISTSNILLEEMNSLQNVYISMFTYVTPADYTEWNGTLDHIFNQISNTKVIELFEDSLTLMKKSGFFPPSLNDLEGLKLSFDDYTWELAFKLINLHPNLKWLVWRRATGCRFNDLHLEMIENFLCFKYHLKTIELYRENPDIATHFLRHCRVLEEMKISFNLCRLAFPSECQTFSLLEYKQVFKAYPRLKFTFNWKIERFEDVPMFMELTEDIKSHPNVQLTYSVNC